jgi:hypothetical protein
MLWRSFATSLDEIIRADKKAMHAEHTDGQWLNELSGNAIGCAFDVFNTLGAAFLEKVYEIALAVESRERGCDVEQQFGITVRYRGIVVGEYFADL